MNTIRIKRRLTGGASGPPSTLENAELAFNEVDNTLYYGGGTGGAGGSADNIIAIAGSGSFFTLAGAQTVSGAKTFSSAITGDLSGNASTATAWETPRDLTISGDATATFSNVDGSATVDAALTLATINSDVGQYTKLTVNGKGLVTAAGTASLSDLSTPTGNISFDSAKITSLGYPENANDAATKSYVDSVAQGLSPKGTARVATTANITLSGTQTIDGVSVVADDRVLVKDQTTASENGIYVVAAGAWTRATDADSWDALVSAYVFVSEGTLGAENGYLCTSDAGGTLDTTNVDFVQFTGAGQIIDGAAISKTGNQLDVVAGTGITVAADSVALAGQALALHQLGTNGLFARTGASTVAARSVATSGNGVSVANGDGVSGDPTISLDATLDAMSQVSFSADTMVYATAADTFATTTLSSFGRTLIDDADASTARTTLGCGTLATQDSDNVSITGGSISGINIDGGSY